MKKKQIADFLSDLFLLFVCLFTYFIGQMIVWIYFYEPLTDDNLSPSEKVEII